ncbi:MAG: glycosyltransferase family 4 protein [Patescibacteria group bacterium]|nr:glycosyltransferase family 4 protein [Patescibacteria group bacterium]
MKILQIHKYYSKSRGGGSVSAFFETKQLLEKRGHKVMTFSMQDDNNESAPEEKYFAHHFDIRETKSFFHKLWLVPRVIYNRDAAQQLDKLLTDHKPDVAHVHNIYHYLTPSIFPVLKKHNVPIVFKLSDYHAICPNYKLFAHGKIDNSCKDKKYYKLFFNRSINNSWAESFVAMIEGYVNKRGGFYDNVDIFAAPSNFMRELGVKYGIPREKIAILRNVLNFSAYGGEVTKEKIFIYMGRVAQEKGLIVAIDAMAQMKKENKLHGWKFIIAGDGPQIEFLQKYVINNDVADIVEFAGFCKKGSDKWLSLMKSASVAILPSIWYDNSPIAISESMAFSSPVIVSDFGGTKEMVQEGGSGFVFETNNSIELAQKMQKFIDDENLVGQMGDNARVWVEDLNSEEKYYQTLMRIYTDLINKNV